MQKIIGLLLVLVASSLVLAKKNQDDFSPGYGLRFSADSNVALPGLTIGSSFTIEFMIRWTNNGGPVVSLANTKDKVVVSVTPIAGFPNNGRLTLTIADGTGASHDVFYDGIPINTWTYVAVVATAKNTYTQVQFYTQDQSSNSPSQAGSAQSDTKLLPYSKKNTCYIGKSGSSLFSGDLDEVKIWSVSLNNGQLGRGRKVKDNSNGNNLVAYWSFNEGSGSTVSDSSKNCFTGTLSTPSPAWILSSPTRVGTCQVWGRRVSISTFDNTAINYRKLGDYYLANSTDLNFQIRVDLAKNRFCSAVTALAFTYGATSVVIDADFASKADSILYINKVPYLLDSFSTADGLSLTKTYTKRSHTYYITGQNPSFDLKVEALPRSGVVNVLLKLSSDPYGGRMAGLCGNFDGLPDSTSPYPVVPDSASLFTALFTRSVPNTDSTFDCVPPPTLQPDIDRVCGDVNTVDDTLYDSCVFDVCAAQDITAAIFSAEVTYNMNCNSTLATGNCAPPCPSFCSFQGTCVNGACQCFSGFGGSDCSERKNLACVTAYWPQGSATLNPFVGSVSGAAHYSYNTPYSDSAATGNEISDATVIYFYQNAADNGTSTSLIFINDQRRDGTGGKLSATFTGTYTSGTRMSFNNNDIVKDDPADTYTNSNGVVTASWKWDPCCTDGIALTKIPLAQPFCINMTITPTTGISQVFFSEQNLFGEQDLITVPVTGSSVNVAICSQTCDNVCSTYTGCSDCLADRRCGWCSETASCETGSAAGPNSGRCSYWRYSNTTVSRVVTTTLAYPVDPAEIDVYVKPNSGMLPVNFYVNFPPLSVVPHDVVTLVELTGSVLDLTLLKLTLVWALNAMTDSYPLVRLGLASFSDKPISPYGSATRGDYAYRTNTALTSNLNTLQKALNGLSTLDGGDSAQSQLEALLQLAVRDEMGWSQTSRRTVIVITKSAFHTPVGGSLTPNNGDGVLGATEDYPAIDQVRTALLDRNIVPVFIVNSGVQSTYDSLVSQLGFGKVIAFSRTDFLGALTAMLTSLDTLAGSATAVIRTPGKVSSVSNGFSGLSPYTRGTFTAMVDSSSSSTDPAVIVVPGFGKLTVNYVSSDLPATEGCVAAAISSTETKIIRLGGSSPIYGGVVSAQITSGPSFGRFFQYVNGVKGAPLDSTGMVQDSGLRVIFDPLSPTANGTATYSFKILDECSSCSSVQTCSIDVTAAVFPPTPVPEAPVLVTEANTVSPPFTIDGANAQGAILPKVVRIPSVGKLFRCQAADCSSPTAPWDEITEDNKTVPSKKIRYSPPRGTVGAPESFVVDCFSFRVKDTATGLESSDATVQLAIIPINAPDPIANSTVAPVDEDTPSQIPLVAGTAGTFTYIITSLPAPGTGDLSPVNDISAKLTGSGPWNLTSAYVFYFPPQDFDQSTSFTFKLYDSNSNLFSAEATVQINLIPKNDAPRAYDNNGLQPPMNSHYPITLQGTDVDSSNLNYYLCAFTDAGTLTSNGVVITPGDYNSNYLALGSNLIYYDSPANQHPTVSFTYTVFDGELFASPCATVTLHVQRVDIAPVAQSGGNVNMNQSTVVTIPLVGYDANQEDNPLSVVICNTASRGSLTQTNGAAIANGQGVLDITVSGSTTVGKVKFSTVGIYDFGAGYAWFTYKVVSANDAPAIATSACVNVTINVNNVNDAPVVTGPSSVPTLEDNPVTFTLNAWDPDGDAMTYRMVSVPSASTEGVLKVASSGAVLSAGSTTTEASLTFVPVLNYNGVTSFTFEVSDPSGATSNQQHVTITVTAQNDPPTAFDALVPATEDTTVDFSLSGSDIEPYDVNTLTYILLSLPPSNYGTLYVCSPACTVASAGTIASRNLRFVPAANVFGTTTFTFRVQDTEGSPSTNVATVTITIASVNDKPVPTAARNITVLSNETVTIVLGGTDVENDPLTATIVNIASVLGAVKNAGSGTDVPVSTGVVSDPNLRIIYVPNRNVNNTSPYTTILYSLSDSQPSDTLGLVNIYVVNADLPPTGASVTVSGTEEVNLFFGLTGSDSDGPGNSVAFVVETVPPASKGVLKRVSDSSVVTAGSTVSDGQLFFVPVTDGQGIAYTSFTYHVTNNGLNSPTYTVTINLANVPDPPTVSIPTALVMNEDGSLTIEMDGFDPDGDSVIFEIVDAPNNDESSPDNYKGYLYRTSDLVNAIQDGGNVTGSPGFVVYKPHPNRFSAPGYTAGFAVIAIDSTGLTSSVLFVNIQVNSVNDPPVAIATTLNAVNNNYVNIFSVTVSDIDAPAGYQFEIYIDQLPVVGKIFYTPSGGSRTEVTQANNHFTGVTFEYDSFYFGNDISANYDNFTFRAYDGQDYSNTARETINIIIVNYIPTPNFATPLQCVEDTVCTYVLNATDPDEVTNGNGAALRWFINVPPSFGTLNTTFGALNDFVTNRPNNQLINSNFDSGWVVKYKPNANWNSAGTSQESFAFTLRDGGSSVGDFYRQGQLTFVNINVQAVNDAPVVTCTSIQNGEIFGGSNNAVSYPGIVLYKSSLSANDVDARPTDILSGTVNCIAANPFYLGALYFMDTSGFSYYDNSTFGTIKFNGTLQAVQAAFSSGFVYLPWKNTTWHNNTFTSFSDNCTFTLNDNGNFGAVFNPLSASCSLPVKYSKGTLRNTSDILSGSVAGAVAGSTTLVSAGIYGVYKLLKKKKILPEDADPWETDEYFDQTTENPLYSGTPTTSSAANVTLVTNDI